MSRDLLLLAAAFGALAFGAGLLVRGAVAVARRLRVSSFVIGLTLVGFGTSAPEMAASVTAGIAGRDNLAVGNVVGSNIMNVTFVLGLSALLGSVAARSQALRGEVLLGIGVALVPWLALLSEGRLERWMGAAMLSGGVLYVLRGFRNGSVGGAKEAAEAALERGFGVTRPGWRQSAVVQVGSIVAGVGFLVVGAVVLVDASVAIARDLGVSELVIGLTVVSIGTSSPELFTSVVAARRGQPDIAIGNVLGSNVLNVLGVLGLTAAIRPQTVAAHVLRLDLPVMGLASLAMLPLAARHGRITRTHGALLLAGYAAYVTALFTVGAARSP